MVQMTIEIKRIQLEILQEKLEEIKKEQYESQDKLLELDIKRQELRKRKIDTESTQEALQLEQQIKILREKIGKLKKIIEARNSIINGLEALI